MVRFVIVVIIAMGALIIGMMTNRVIVGVALVGPDDCGACCVPQRDDGVLPYGTATGAVTYMRMLLPCDGPVWISR